MAKADRVAVRPFGKNARVGGNVTRSTRRLKSYPPPFFFFFLQKPSLVPVTGGTVHLRPRGRDGPGFQAGVARPAGASGLFFFPPEALSVAVTRGACTSDAERTRWARLPGRCGPVSWSFGSFFFFFSSRSPLLSPSPGAPYI